MQKRILFTGGSSLLALNWAIAIRDQFDVVLGLHHKSIVLHGVQHYPLDLTSVESLVCALQEIKPHIVIHSAALTSVERCESDPKLAFHVNAQIAEVVAIACCSQNLSLVHISTDHLFSGNHPMSSEVDPVAPVNVYGKTKAAAEVLVRTFYPEALIIRTNFFGWGTSYRPSFSDFIITNLRTRNPIFLYDDVYFTPILVESLAFVVHSLINQHVHGIHNVVGDERISKHYFGLKLAEKLCLDPSLIHRRLITNVPGQVQRPRDMSLSNLKVRDILGRDLGSLNHYLNMLACQEELGLSLEIRNLSFNINLHST